LELFVSFVAPSLEVLILLGIAVAIIAELSLTFWLLLKGAKAAPGGDQNPALASP